MNLALWQTSEARAILLSSLVVLHHQGASELIEGLVKISQPISRELEAVGSLESALSKAPTLAKDTCEDPFPWESSASYACSEQPGALLARSAPSPSSSPPLP